MGLFGAGEEFFCEGLVIFPALDAASACAVAGLAAVEIERTSVVFLRCGGDVRAGHETFDPKRGSPPYKFVSEYSLY